MSSEYFVSSNRIFVKYGIISRRIFEIRSEWVTSIVVRQGVGGRLLNYGDVIISVPGHYLGTVAMFSVSDPSNPQIIIQPLLSSSPKL